MLVDGQVAGGQGSGCIRCGHVARLRDVASSIGQTDIQAFAIDLGWVQGHGEGAVGAHSAAADQVAGAVAYIHRGTDLAAASQAQAIGRNQQVYGRGGWRGVAWRRAVAAATASTTAACGGGCAANAQQAQPGNRPGRGFAASAADACDQFIERGDFLEGETGEGFGIVVGVPQGAIFADEDHVTADTRLVHGKEVADGNLFP